MALDHEPFGKHFESGKIVGVDSEENNFEHCQNALSFFFCEMKMHLRRSNSKSCCTLNKILRLNNNMHLNIINLTIRCPCKGKTRLKSCTFTQ